MAVVGAAHVPGIKVQWEEEGIDIPGLMSLKVYSRPAADGKRAPPWRRLANLVSVLSAGIIVWQCVHSQRASQQGVGCCSHTK